MNTFILAIISFLCHFNSQYFLYTYKKENINRVPLNDILHEIIPEKKTKLHDYFCVIQTGFLITYLILKNKKTLFFKFVNIISILFILRSISMIVTILPTPKNCNKPPFILGGCGDLIFSGHFTLNTTVLYILLNKIGIHYFIKIYFIFAYFLSIISTIASRDHYTIDIFIAILLSFLITDRNL